MCTNRVQSKLLYIIISIWCWRYLAKRTISAWDWCSSKRKKEEEKRIKLIENILNRSTNEDNKKSGTVDVLSLCLDFAKYYERTHRKRGGRKESATFKVDKKNREMEKLMRTWIKYDKQTFERWWKPASWIKVSFHYKIVAAYILRFLMLKWKQ